MLKLSKAKARMLLDHPFFSTILLSMELVEDTTGVLPCPTMGTNGKQLIFNRDFVDELSVGHLVTVLCHEVLHVALEHCLRVQGRNPTVWNMAADHAINLTLTDQGLEFPPGDYCCDPQFKGMSAEQIYDKLMRDAEKSPQGMAGLENQAGNNPLNGDVLPMPGAGDPAAVAQARHETRQLVAQAANMARMAGKLKGDLARLVGDILDSKVPWPDILRDYMMRTTKDDESWTRRNRRFSDVYLPTRWSERMGEIIFIGDTSGSISQDELTKVVGEIKAVADLCQPERIRVVWADTGVASEETFEDGEPIIVKPAGGGGTDMRVPLEHIEQYEPQVVVLCTDGYTPWPSGEPPYPLIVLCTTEVDVPVGQVIRV